MFTGIIEELGKLNNIITRNNSTQISFSGKSILHDTKVGDSVSVNGVCITITKIIDNLFFADLSPETLSRTTFKLLKMGAEVNLERALAVNKRLGGHFVSGHVDTISEIVSISKIRNSKIIKVRIEHSYLKYIVLKGSVAIDGISLTIMNITNNDFDVSIIPHTFSLTNLNNIKSGDKVNIEFDILGKYIERLLILNKEQKSSLSEEYLKKMGFF